MPNESSSSVRISYPKYDRKEVIELIKEKLPELNEKMPLKKVVLFGSYARGNFTAASDIDLLVIYRGKPAKDTFRVVKETLEISRLEPHIYSEEEYEESKQVVKRMEKGGVVLWNNQDNPR